MFHRVSGSGMRVRAERHTVFHCMSGINVSFLEWVMEVDECCLVLMDGFIRCVIENF